MTTRPGAPRRWAWSLTALSVLALSATACSARATPDPPAPAVSEAASGAAASQSRAAELLAGLAHLLVERSYLSESVTSAVLAADGRLEAPSVDGQLQSLDASSVALSNLLGASYLSARNPLLATLRTVDRRSVDYATARASGDPVRLARTLRDLEASPGELATLVRRVVPRLQTEILATRFSADLQAQLAVGGSDPYALLRRAAGRAPGTARLLTEGIAADRDLGPAGTAAATLRADLTAAMTEHTMLVGALAREVRLPGGAAASAATALGANAAELASVLGRVYPPLQAPARQLLDRHDAGLIAYVQARVAGSGEAQRGAVLAQPTEFGELLGRYVGGLPASTLARESAAALDALVAAIDATVSGAPQSPQVLRQAASVVPAVAALLAAAIAEDQRLG